MIKYNKEAEKFIFTQNKATAIRLYNAIKKIPAGDIKKLRGTHNPTLYRLRVGNFRVIYYYPEQDQITIVRIDNRGDVYKNL